MSDVGLSEILMKDPCHKPRAVSVSVMVKHQLVVGWVVQLVRWVEGQDLEAENLSWPWAWFSHFLVT